MQKTNKVIVVKKLSRKEEVFKREFLRAMIDKGLISQGDQIALLANESSVLVLNYYTQKICKQMESKTVHKVKDYLREFYETVNSGMLQESMTMYVKEDEVLAS